MSNIPVAEVAEEKKCVVNCPKCSTSLNVKMGNYAHVCPVCNQIFRTRMGERLVKDVSRKTMVEAFVSVDKDAQGAVNADSVVNDEN
ncbi:MAG: hypothetical protein J6K86_01985 [Clostridia bacterium]|nr:hypothetical protein [Clostridia bacterium]MBP3422514.1 hypothetical protein [Clostridia bacterium]